MLSNPSPDQNAAFTPFSNGLASGAISVESGAQIQTLSGGRVMLLAPQVSNNGIIQSPMSAWFSYSSKSASLLVLQRLR